MAAIDFARLQQSLAYDSLMRLPMLGWSVLAAAAQMAGLARYVAEAGPALSYSVLAVNLAMRASTIAFFLLLAAAVILRAPPAGRARGIEPRISALIGTFLAPAISFFPRRDLPVTAEMLAALLTFLGTAAAAAVLLRLGRSFSIMAEARQLVTTGPYRLVRHPLYLAEEIALFGVLLQFFALGTALIFAVQVAFQLRRMHNEELVLSASFAEYAAYRLKTARLLPGIY
jgi:protein-S-isoprenylcysteine O-methyltransferase Ste14